MYQREQRPSMGLQHPSDSHTTSLNNYSATATASTYSYQVSSHTQEVFPDKEIMHDQDKKTKKRHRRNSRSICTPDVLRHKIKGAEGQVWTNLSSWTNGRVDTIDFGNGKKKSSSKGSSRRGSVQSSMTEQHVHCDNNNYHHTYNTSTNVHHALYYMENPGQQQQLGDQIYSSEEKEKDELAWALHISKISDTPPEVNTSPLPSPVSQATSIWSTAPSVQSSNLSSLDSVSRWSTVAPSRAPTLADSSAAPSQSSRSHRRGTSLVDSISPSSSASNMTPPISTTSRRSRARASSSPSAMDQNIAQQYIVLPEKYQTSRAADTNAKELPQYWLANKFEHASHNADELPPSYSGLSCAQPRRASIAPSAAPSSSSSSRSSSLRRAHKSWNGSSTGRGQSYLSRNDLPGKTKEEKWMADQAESVLGSHHNFPHYHVHDNGTMSVRRRG